MKDSVNQVVVLLNEGSEQSCTKTFKTATSELVNSYLCHQERFNVADLWNVQTQKREFPQPVIISLFN
jgi:hypothetical protein